MRVRVHGQSGCGVWVCGVNQCAGAGCGVRLNWRSHGNWCVDVARALARHNNLFNTLHFGKNGPTRQTSSSNLHFPHMHGSCMFD